jgi:hypothetical protein
MGSVAMLEHMLVPQDASRADDNEDPSVMNELWRRIQEGTSANHGQTQIRGLDAVHADNLLLGLQARCLLRDIMHLLFMEAL